jgi:predicted RND superfamily exporter protein
LGIDDGIHVVHEFARTGARPHLSRPTVVGLVLTSLTSMIGFGSLLGAQHAGLRSLGRVVTLGIACCLLTSVVVLPCVLQLGVGRRRRFAADSVSGSKAADAPS